MSGLQRCGTGERMYDCRGGSGIRSDRHYRAGRNGNVSVIDGPSADTKEQLADFYLVDARNLDGVIQIAAKIPAARVGSVEVRPIPGFGVSTRRLKPIHED